jgi:hypothetical protein
MALIYSGCQPVYSRAAIRADFGCVVVPERRGGVDAGFRLRCALVSRRRGLLGRGAFWDRYPGACAPWLNDVAAPRLGIVMLESLRELGAQVETA